jgi:hypothetical protein
MNSHRTKSFTTIVIALIGASFLAPSSSSATAEPVWGDGTIVTHDDGAHSENGGGEVKSIVCSSAGNCTAVGEFTNPSTYPQAFTMSSVNGVWSRARPTAFADGVRNPSNESELLSVSCASAGNCAAVGTYLDADERNQPFITQSSNGTWTDATLVAFPVGAQNTYRDAKLLSVSCTSVGSCTAVGHYASSDDSTKPLVVTSTAGSWGAPIAVDFPSGTVPAEYYAKLKKVSCSSPGNCTAVGTYYEADRDSQGFTVSSVDGTWSTARTVVFPPNTFNTRAEAEAHDVSCPSNGNCTVVGYFADTTGAYRGYAVSSSGGVWSTTHTLEPGSWLDSVSCTSAGNCTAVGIVYSPPRTYAIRITSVDGVWGQTQEVSFPAAAQNSVTTVLDRVSCGSAGSCTATGYFRNTDGANEAFTTTSVGGVWGTARPVVYATGSGASRRPGYIKAVSCTSGGLCTVGGRFTLSSGNNEIFVMSSNEAPPATTTLPATTVPSSSTVAPTTTLAPPALDTVRALPPAPTPIVADNSIDTGEAITVSFGGFTPFEYVQLVVASTPQVIGSGYANAQGVVTLTGNLPTNLTSGTHTLAVYAPGSGIGFTQPITVTALTLPTTGSTRGDGGAQVALWVLLAGIGAIVVARRRNA